MHRWFIAKMFFEWVPIPLPAYTRRDGDFLLAQPRDYPEMVYLNTPGAFIFEQCDGRTDVETILKRYMVEFLRGDRAAAAYEVVQVLRQLDRRLIVYFGPPESNHPNAVVPYEQQTA